MERSRTLQSTVCALCVVCSAWLTLVPCRVSAQVDATPSNDDQAGDRRGGDERESDGSVSTLELLASETGFGLGLAVIGGTLGGVSGFAGGGTFVLFNPDVRTQERAGRVLLGSAAVGTGIGAATGLPFGVFIGGDRLGADGKQGWATAGSLIGSGAAVATWVATRGNDRWLPARIAVLPLPLILSITAFEISRPPDDELENQAAPIFSRNGRRPQWVPVFSAADASGRMRLQLGVAGRF